MRLSDALCYIFLTVTIFLTCVKTEEQNTLEESKAGRRIRKRDTTLLIENYPFETIVKKPKMVYRRISTHNYVPPKPKYPKSKYGPKARRSPAQRFRAKLKMPKHALSHYKNRPPKPKYGSKPKLQKPNPNPVFRPPKQALVYTYFSPVSSGFAEPPVHDYRSSKHVYSDHPVDHNGEPIKLGQDIYSLAPSYPPNTGHLENQDFNFRQVYKSWAGIVPQQNADTVHEYSKKAPVLTKPDAPIYAGPAPIDEYDNVNIEPETSMTKQDYNVEKNKKRLFSNTKIVKKPWRIPRKPDADDEIIVGGKYAEPPARYVQKLQQSAPMYEDEEDLNPHQPFDAVPYATQSPYVNYKNSNLAFSPQNLNDAFGIVDE